MDGLDNPTTYFLSPKIPFDAVYPLTPIDAIMPRVFTRLFLIYDASGEPLTYREHLVNRLRDGLQSILQLHSEGGRPVYPHLLGRIHEDDEDGHLEIRVSAGNRVRFVVRREDAKELEVSELVHAGLEGGIFAPMEMLPVMHDDGGVDVFAAQVTFVNDGFVIAVSVHHAAADAAGLGGLVKHWFANARTTGKEEKGLRVQHGDILDRRNLLSTEGSAADDDDHPEYSVVVPGSSLSLPARPPGFQVPEMMPVIFHFSPRALADLKRAAAPGSEKWISTNDALTALVWRCVTKARFASSSEDEKAAQTSRLGMATDCRRYLNPPLPRDYVGNVNFYASTTNTVAKLTSSDPSTLGDIARDVRQAVSRTRTDSHCRSAVRFIAKQPKPSYVQYGFKASHGPDLAVTSWESMFDSREQVSLGVGRILCTRVPKAKFDGLAIVLPAFGERDGGTAPDDGGLEVLLGLSKTHVEALTQDEEWTRFARRSGL